MALNGVSRDSAVRTLLAWLSILSLGNINNRQGAEVVVRNLPAFVDICYFSAQEQRGDLAKEGYDTQRLLLQLLRVGRI